jgi:hypothetical protein
MAGFLQVIEFETSRIEEVQALTKKLEAERGGDQTVSKGTIAADRDRPGHYVIIAEFDSYEEAMKNSNDPVTDKYAQEMQKLTDGPSKFHNLDVLTVTDFHR